MEWINLSDKRKALEAEAQKQGKSFKVKTYPNDSVGLEPDKGDYVATICTDNPDDEGEVIQPRLMDFTRFNKVQAVHLEHNIESLPIGRCKWIKSNDHSIIAKYYISQATPESRAVDFMLKEGVLHMHSISFIGDKAVSPSQMDIQQHPDWKGNKVYKGNPLMIEFSVVGQPANADCDMISVAKRFGKDVVDRLTGKTSNTIQEAAKIVEEVKELPVKTESEIRQAIAERMEQLTILVDYDKLINAAMKKLY